MKKRNIDYSNWDPYILNDYKDHEWSYSKIRLQFLQKLGDMDNTLNDIT